MKQLDSTKLIIQQHGQDAVTRLQNAMVSAVNDICYGSKDGWATLEQVRADPVVLELIREYNVAPKCSSCILNNLANHRKDNRIWATGKLKTKRYFTAESRPDLLPASAHMLDEYDDARKFNKEQRNRAIALFNDPSTPEAIKKQLDEVYGITPKPAPQDNPNAFVRDVDVDVSELKRKLSEAEIEIIGLKQKLADVNAYADGLEGVIYRTATAIPKDFLEVAQAIEQRKFSK